MVNLIKWDLAVDTGREGACDDYAAWSSSKLALLAQSEDIKESFQSRLTFICSRRGCEVAKLLADMCTLWSMNQPMDPRSLDEWAWSSSAGFRILLP
jgi:hypothetical protein